MNNNSVGANMNLLFVGYAISLAVSVLGLLGISGGIVSLANLVGLVIIMISLDRLKSSHPGYGKAFQYEIILIVFAVISVIVLIVAVLIPFLLWPVVLLMAVGSNILNYLVVRFTSLSTADLVGREGDVDTAALGAKVDQIYLVCTAVSVICTVLGVIPILGSIFNLLGKLTSLASIVGLGLLVYFLYRAKTCLN